MLLTSPAWRLKWPSWRSLVILEKPGQKSGNNYFGFYQLKEGPKTKENLDMTKVICRLCRTKYANKGLWHVCFVDFVSVSLELLQCNLELKNSLKTLSYYFDFYVGEKYMECLLVDFSDYNR